MYGDHRERFAGELFPFACGGQQLQSDGERIAVEGLAIDDPSPGPEMTRQGPQIQPLIQFPGITQNDAGAVGTYVFRKALLRTMTDIQAAEVHSYCQGNAFFQAARNRLHETPHCPAQKLGGWVSGVGTTSVSYSCQGGIGRNSRSRETSASETLTRHRYWRTGYTIVLQVYRPLLKRAGKSGLFRGS